MHLPACLHMQYVCLVPMSEEGASPPGAGATEGSEPPCGSWEPHPGYLNFGAIWHFKLFCWGQGWAELAQEGLGWSSVMNKTRCGGAHLHLGVKEAEKFKVIVNYVVSLRPFGAVRDCLTQPNLCRWSVHSNDFSVFSVVKWLSPSHSRILKPSPKLCPT